MDGVASRRFVCPFIPEDLEEEAFVRIPNENRFFFSGAEERVEVIQTGALSQLMYEKDFRPLEEVLAEVNRDVFEPNGHHLEAFQTSADLGITMPQGCSIQAFREVVTGRIFVAIRGTQLDLDPDTKIHNLIVDLGIGDLKEPSDLNDSIQDVCNHISTYHNVDLTSPARVLASTVGEAIVQRKVTGTTSSERHSSILKGYIDDAMSSCKWAYGHAASAALSAKEYTAENPWKAAAVTAAGATAAAFVGPAAVLSASAGLVSKVTGFSLLVHSAKTLGRATVAAASTVAPYVLAKKSSYQILTEYVKACDEYITTLKRRGEILEDTQVTVTGHSLGGYLSGVVGAIHANRVVAHNGPGVIFENDVTKICTTLGLERAVRADVTYNSYSQRGDFIGNLFRRSGPSKGLNFSCATYPSPLSHHGIKIMNLIYKILPVAPLPDPRANLLNGARDQDDQSLTSFSTATYYSPSDVLMLEDQKPSEA
ncbi:MAG: hypothetical protein FJZ59_05180 [Chlamydiae bacterium]|nr:hypothetical protein [Chlamydiota bacterium]